MKCELFGKLMPYLSLYSIGSGRSLTCFDSRTFKDFITFIPFVIILLIPLSPIGHVMVFGAIQRFFPDFFPSCFTEQRQNLLQVRFIIFSLYVVLPSRSNSCFSSTRRQSTGNFRLTKTGKRSLLVSQKHLSTLLLLHQRKCSKI